jgi:hypothetical protein
MIDIADYVSADPTEGECVMSDVHAGIEAIQTVYRGYRFRSRLEARWAVFFDALTLTWQYEPEGFVLPDGRGYLPDFHVNDIGWLEIKPTVDAAQHDDKWALFSTLCLCCGVARGRLYCEACLPHTTPTIHGWRQTYRDIHGHACPGNKGARAEPSFLLIGNIPEPGYDVCGGTFDIHVYGDFSYAWCVCPTCLKVGITFNGRGARVCRHDPTDDKSYSYDHPLITQAYTKARQARFEHGEHPW